MEQLSKVETIFDALGLIDCYMEEGSVTTEKMDELLNELVRLDRIIFSGKIVHPVEGAMLQTPAETLFIYSGGTFSSTYIIFNLSAFDNHRIYAEETYIRIILETGGSGIEVQFSIG